MPSSRDARDQRPPRTPRQAQQERWATDHLQGLAAAERLPAASRSERAALQDLVRLGDTAIAALLADVEPYLQRKVRTWGLGDEDDALPSVIERALRAMRRWRPGRAGPLTWIDRSVRDVGRTLHERREKRPVPQDVIPEGARAPGEIPPAWADPERAALDADEVRRAGEAITTLLATLPAGDARLVHSYLNGGTVVERLSAADRARAVALVVHPVMGVAGRLAADCDPPAPRLVGIDERTDAEWLAEVVDPRPGWQQGAACLDADPAELFLPKGARIAEATLARCARCPVRLDCLTAGSTTVRPGVWGGYTQLGRRHLQRLVRRRRR